jgi:hypothetical protein
MLLARVGNGYTEEVGGRIGIVADGSLCKGREGVDALDIISWPPQKALSASLTGSSSP